MFVGAGEVAAVEGLKTWSYGYSVFLFLIRKTLYSNFCLLGRAFLVIDYASREANGVYYLLNLWSWYME